MQSSKWVASEDNGGPNLPIGTGVDDPEILLKAEESLAPTYSKGNK